MASAKPLTVAELAARVEEDAQRLDRELDEVDLLVQQARMEAARHEQRQAQQAERVATIEGHPQAGPPELREAVAQLTTLTRRAALMEAQIEVLEGKRRVLSRFRDRMRELTTALSAAVSQPWEVGEEVAGEAPEQEPAVPPALSRAVLNAQEDLRRDIARAMHDGPAQSLTNIVLQAQIVERLMGRDPATAQAEAHQLVEMVQQTLDATKTFIFDVRPMVLDDLGLVPTLRRAARDRGRKALVPVSFDSIGADRRLPADVESGLFRIIDEALDAFLRARPANVAIRLEWSDSYVVASIGAEPAQAPAPEAASPAGEPAVPAEPSPDTPPALAAMIVEQRETATRAREAALRASELVLPPAVWKSIAQRAGTVGVHVELGPDGRTMTARVGLS